MWLIFPGARLNVILPCLPNLCICGPARQALICKHFCYHATDFDTLRTSCLILSIITLLHLNVSSLEIACELCISSVPTDERHLQLSARCHTCGIFKSCVVQHPCYAYNLGFEHPLCHSESKVFEVASGFWKIFGPQP